MKDAGNLEDNVMSSVVEALNFIEEIIGAVTIGTKLKTVLPFDAHATDLTPRRIRGLWSGEAKAILHEEISALQRAREESVHARNLATRDRLALRRAAAPPGVEAADL